MKRLLLASLLALAANLSAGGGRALDVVTIGIINAYSGQFADTGNQIDNGIKLYVKQHGDTVAGKKLVFIRKDVGGVAPDLAKRLAQELIVRDHADILAGFALTPNALAAGDISAEAKKFMVVMTASGAMITTKSPYITRSSSASPQLNYTLGTWAAKHGIKTMFTMVSDYSPGIDGETWFQTGFKEADGQIVGSVRFPVVNPDFSAFVQRAKDSNAEGVYIWVPGGAQPTAMGKALAERGIDIAKKQVMGQEAFVDENGLRGSGDAAIGFISVSEYDYNHDSALNHEFVKAYNDAYHRNPDIFTIGAYDGMHLIYEALKKTDGNADGEALVAAAKGMAWESPRGPISIDPETRDIIQTIYIRRVEKVGAELRNIEFEKIENVKDPMKERIKK